MPRRLDGETLDLLDGGSCENSPAVHEVGLEVKELPRASLCCHLNPALLEPRELEVVFVAGARMLLAGSPLTRGVRRQVRKTLSGFESWVYHHRADL